jgi:hypothetical protein
VTGPAGFVPVPHDGRTIWVMPDYYKRGGVRIPVDVAEAERIRREMSQELGVTLSLPTAAMVDSIWRAADVKLAPYPLSDRNTGNPRFYESGPGGMTDPKWIAFHDDIIETQLGGRIGLIAGHKKDILRDPARGKIRIYGWHQSNGRPIQPDSNPHGASYADYSHGLRLVYDPGVSAQKPIGETPMAIVRSITHWTAGGPRANEIDKKHYHKITNFDGTVVDGNEAIEDNIVTSDGDYAAHTLNLNTGSAGFAMAGMHDANENPFEPGPYPITEVQFEAHCRMLAQFHSDYAILPITRQNCLTHAEVEPTLGVKQRGKWDITRLPFKPELRGAIPCGDYMRSRVNAYLGVTEKPPETNRPILRMGDRGPFVLDAQGQLRDLRYQVGKLDGIFGRRTKDAVMAFQDAQGLMADGVIGPQTWMALRDAQPRPERDVSEEDLAGRSRTYDTAASGKNVATIGGAVATATVAISEAQNVVAVAQQAEGVLEQIGTIAPSIIAVLAVGAVAYFAWRYFDKIRAIRLEDARTGRNDGV